MAVPLAIVCLIESLLEARRRYGSGPLFYVVCSASTLVVYLPLAVWLGAWIGLRVRNRARALLSVLGTLAVWIFAVPELVRMAIGGSGAGALSTSTS